CAPGKAILANLPEDECSKIVEGFKFEKFTENTIVNRRGLRAELKEIRERGYALDRGENFVGINCVGVPVLDRHGYPVGGITVAGPSSRVVEAKFEPFVEILQAAAQRIAGEFDQ
ncbi:MAG: IclR family transcriptional regulator, partial [Limisphaerales bacterium]